MDICTAYWTGNLNFFLSVQYVSQLDNMVFGGLLLHGIWDSFADSPYGIFIPVYTVCVSLFH